MTDCTQRGFYRLATLVAIGIALSGSRLIAADNKIDLTKVNGAGTIVLPAPDSDDNRTARRVLLPAFGKFCHVAADGTHFRWIGASNRMFPWIGDGGDLTSVFRARTPTPPSIPNPNRRAMLMMFQLKNGKFLAIMPLSGEASVSWLQTQKDGTLILDYGTVGTGTVPKDVAVPLLAYGTGDNIYAALAEMWRTVVQDKNFHGHLHLRSQREYPEELRYLGWCTWEQYHKGIDEKIITGAIDGIEKSGVPVRWVLIDDGHQTAIGRSMVSMEPDKKKFPNGWGPIVAKKSRDKVRWIGIWHTLLMHWDAVSARHKMPELAPFLMPQPGNAKVLLIKDDPNASRAFYAKFMGDVRRQGFDFVKTDNVSRSTLDYDRTPNAARPQKNNVRSLEAACHKLGLGLMNCSAQNTIDMLNTTYSATMRTSPDYKKGNPASSKSQILQSVFNVSWLGQTLWPDHDMFHSSDKPVAEAMAVTKAMSGGPIYLSDAPKDFRKEIIAPLCYRDGLLIRPDAPAAPLPDCFFTDPLYANESYKVIAPLADQACAIAAYNLNLKQGSTQTGQILPRDYACASVMSQPYPGPWKLPAEGLILYDWDARTASRLGPDGHEFKINGFGHKLFLLTPVRQGWSIIGRPDKYLAPATVAIQTVDADSVALTMHEPAPILVYSAKGKPQSDSFTFQARKDGIYLATPRKDVKPDSPLRIHR